MSRDASGNFNLPAGNPVVSGSIITSGTANIPGSGWANPTLADIAAGLTDSLSRSGKGGMAAPLDMGGYRIVAMGLATAPTDVPQAIQVRDQSFTVLALTVDASGNNYVGTALLTVPPNSGTTYLLAAGGSTNTGPMTLAVNGGAALPILINGAPVPPGLVVAGSITFVVYDGFSSYRIIGLASSGGTVNSVQSADPAVISVVNASGTNIATLTPHTNVAAGMVKLDGSAKIPVAQLPFTALQYVGIWNATPGTNPPTTGLANGSYYVITVAGSLTVYRDSGGNVYTPQVTAVAVGAAIILRVGSTNPNQPDGWYYDPAAAAAAVASTTSMTATPTLPAVTVVQTWMDQFDPIIASKLPLAGGTMTGPIIQPALPATATALANRQYVDNKTAALVGVLSFNSRTGAVALTSPDVTGALGYTPASTNSPTFTGNVGINSGNLVVPAGGVGALYFAPTYFINDAAPASLVIDFFNGQSQRIGLTANTTITSIINVPQGSILRLILLNTTFTVTWPGSVSWPLGVAPSLAAGPVKLAIVVLEAVSPGGYLASATVY